MEGSFGESHVQTVCISLCLILLLPTYKVKRESGFQLAVLDTVLRDRLYLDFLPMFDQDFIQYFDIGHAFKGLKDCPLVCLLGKYPFSTVKQTSYMEKIVNNNKNGLRALIQ